MLAIMHLSCVESRFALHAIFLDILYKFEEKQKRTIVLLMRSMY